MAEKPYFSEETDGVGRDRRIDEQAGVRARTGAIVRAKDHDSDYQSSKGQGLGNDFLSENQMEGHPALAWSQATDGADKKMSQDPHTHPTAADEYNLQLELQLEHQKKMELTKAPDWVPPRPSR